MSTIIVVAKALVFTATSSVVEKLFVTTLMPTTCSYIFFAGKSTFRSNFAFFSTTHVAVKNIFFL